MKSHLRLSLPFILATLALLTACELPATHRYNIIFGFEQPYGHSAYPVAPLDIVVAVDVPYPPGYRPGSVPGSQPILNNVNFFVNGVEIGSATIISVDSYPTVSLGGTTIGQLFHASRTWTPPGPGIYYIQAQAILNLGSQVNGDYSASDRICVIADATEIRMCVTYGITPIPYSAPFTFFTPTPTSTLIPIPTETPQGLCPPGTYYSSTTNQCIPVQIKPTKSGGVCSQYTNPSACTSNGCSWDKPSSTCH